jgi:V-type H+-transporting ATPase subunit H
LRRAALTPPPLVSHRKYDLLPSFLLLARTSPKQKVLRIIMATLANLLRLAPEVNTPALLAAGGLTFVNGLEKGGKGVRGDDEELVADLEFVTSALKERAQTLSSVSPA